MLGEFAGFWASVIAAATTTFRRGNEGWSTLLLHWSASSLDLGEKTRAFDVELVRIERGVMFAVC